MIPNISTIGGPVVCSGVEMCGNEWIIPQESQINASDLLVPNSYLLMQIFTQISVQTLAYSSKSKLIKYEFDVAWMIRIWTELYCIVQYYS
jgi:hypothetical protein